MEVGGGFKFCQASRFLILSAVDVYMYTYVRTVYRDSLDSKPRNARGLQLKFKRFRVAGDPVTTSGSTSFLPARPNRAPEEILFARTNLSKRRPSAIIRK